MDITHQVPKIPPIGDITHAMGFQNFVLEKREEDPSDAQCCSVSVNTADRSDCNTLESLCTLPTIHDQVLLQTRPWRGFPLVAPLPSGSNHAKNLQMLVPR